MSKYFEINGYWKDDKSEFSGYIVKEFDDVDEETDDQIFFYGMGVKDLREAVELVEDTMHDFVITSYEETNL